MFGPGDVAKYRGRLFVSHGPRQFPISLTSSRPTTTPMPSSARKSSIGGARRGIQKAHIPYRGDNPEVGKKTGIGIAHVERMSDGFEPFEEILQQADKRPPPKLKTRKKSIPAVQQQEYDDEDGEMSMELDDSRTRFALAIYAAN